jgi:hypothetical protein
MIDGRNRELLVADVTFLPRIWRRGQMRLIVPLPQKIYFMVIGPASWQARVRFNPRPESASFDERSRRRCGAAVTVPW